MAGRVAYYGGIVKDGLVLNLDAAKRDSYSGTGTTWSDISGNQLTGSLVNGPTFDPLNGGSIVFDGSNDYVNLGVNTLLLTSRTFSIEAWLISNNIVLEQIIWSNNAGFSSGYHVGIYNSKLYMQGYSSPSIFGTGAVLSSNVWTHMVYTYNNSVSTLYRNGTLYATTGAGTNFTIPTGVTHIGRYAGGGGNLNGKISTVKYYNKILSATEIQQNYNATKGRYGL